MEAWPYLLSGGATLIASLVALFGDRVRSLIFKPVLVVELANPHGELNKNMPAMVSAKKKAVEIRYYHLKARNVALGRWPVANDVRAYLTELEEERQGQYVSHWKQRIPLNLRHERAFAPRRVLGPEMEIDFFAVTDGTDGLESPCLVFQVVDGPNNAVVVFRCACRLRVTVEVDSIEAVSQPTQIEIRWDGEWNSGTIEMGKHLTVKQLTGPVSRT